MISSYRWHLAALMLSICWGIQSSAWGEELCPHCAQKDSYSPTQKFANGNKGYGKGVSQKGHEQKGYAHKGYGHHMKEHKWFFSHEPPDAPIFESAAIRRVPLPQQVNFRIQREAGQLRPEAAVAPQAEAAVAPTTSDINERLTNLEKHVARLYASLDQLVEQLQED